MLTARPRQISLIPQALQSGTPFVPAEGNRSAAYRLAKRASDLLGAAALLALLGPLMLLVLLVLTVTTRGKPLYWQRRVGYRGRVFLMFKFRTMPPEAEKIQHEVENEQEGPIFKNRRDPRITRLGRLLRKTSLDETPQLLNVLLGQMSLVGPRPPAVQEVEQYRAWQCRRLAVVPGLTCLWQVTDGARSASRTGSAWTSGTCATRTFGRISSYYCVLRSACSAAAERIEEGLEIGD